MSSRQETAILSAVALVGLAIWLASDPRCDRGCKTVAEHLIEHGIGDLFKALLA